MDLLLQPQYLARVLSGLKLTLLLAIASWGVAFLSGIVLAVLRITVSRTFDHLTSLWIEYQRNVPIIVHIFVWYFGITQLLPLAIQDWTNENHGAFLFAAIAIGLYYGAYICEDIRSGYRGLPKGQYEAARSIGLTFLQSMLLVLLPQAMQAAQPALTSRAILLLKSTSLAMVIGVMELSYEAREIQHETFRTFDAFFIATIIYIALAFILLAFGRAIESRTRKRAQ